MTSRSCCLQRAEQVEAAHPGHDQVAQDDRRADRSASFSSASCAVARHLDGKSPAPQQLLQSHPLRGVVFDDQDAVVGVQVVVSFTHE